MPKKLVFVCSLVLVLALAAACGGGDETSGLPPVGDGPAAGPTFDMSAATAVVSGKIVFEGTPPPAQRIQMSADPYCQRSAENPVTEEVVVSDGGLENVIVYVQSGLDGMRFAAPTQPAVLDQQQCHYTPHVFTMQANQPLEVRNSDMTLHNVNVQAQQNRPQNIGQAVQGMVSVINFDQEEMPVPVRCDVHRWMNAYIGVFNHPFHTVSTAGGMWELRLPPGTYEIVTWHEKYGTQSQTVEVGDNDSQELSFAYREG